MPFDHPDVLTLGGARQGSGSASYLAEPGTFTRCLMLFSGGLDTSVLAHWIRDAYDCEVFTFTLDIGQQEDFNALERKAYALGATRHFLVDARQEFLEDFCWRAIKANATVSKYGHPISSSLTRPLMVRHAIEIAAREGITVIAHGASGKSNDSLRMDTAALTLNPEIRILAPVREFSITREAELEYVRRHGISVTATPEKSFSIDDNLWARETEAGLLLQTEIPAPDAAFSLVPPADMTRADPETVQIDFVEGVPVGLNGEELKPLQLVETLNMLGAAHGVGRFDFMEDRGVGVKVRELHEAPAAEILLRAHLDLQELTSTKEELRFARTAELEWVEAALHGYWYTPFVRALNMYFDESQKRLTGSATVLLHRDKATVVARRSPYALDLTNLVAQGFFPGVNERATAPFIEVAGLQRRASQWMASRAQQSTPS